MSESIWHTELNDFEKEQGFCCLFFTKSEPKTLCLGCYNPCTQMFGNYMNHKSYLPNEIDKFANVENLVHIETELERTRKALELIRKEMSNEYMPDFAVIRDALKTALEQKEE